MCEKITWFTDLSSHYKHIILGTSPFSIAQAKMLSDDGESDITLLSSHDGFGGVWKNTIVAGKTIEAFPHAIEFSQNHHLDILEDFFECDFVEEKSESVSFWYNGITYRPASRFDSLRLSLRMFANDKNIKLFWRNLQHVLRRRRYCKPVSGFTTISDCLRRICERLDLTIITEDVLSVASMAKKQILISGITDSYVCENFYFTRGSQNLELQLNDQLVTFKATKKTTLYYVQGESINLRRYNKFLRHPVIDRISHARDGIWIVQLNFQDAQTANDMRGSDLVSILKDEGLFQGTVEMAGQATTHASSFNVPDVVFAELSKRLPKHVKFIDSKALNYICKILDSNS